MRDLMMAGARVRLRLAAAANGWERAETIPGEDGSPLVCWRRTDGSVYLTGDPETMPSPLAERVRVLLIAFMDHRCPVCAGRAGWLEGGLPDDLDRVQPVPVGAVAGGVPITSGTAFVIVHAAICPARPGAIEAAAMAVAN